MALTDPIVVAGAGVAGLSAAYRLEGQVDTPVLVYEAQHEVGGYCRTLRHGEFRFDLGGHRFYTRKAHVQRIVEDVVGDDLLTVERVSHILFNGRFVSYPLKPFDTLRALGLRGAGRAVYDYGAVKLRRTLAGTGVEKTFEQWALNRFGRYLYEVYFKVYSEKTWGVPCTELSADFAEQRIKGLSFREAVKDALLRRGEDDSLVRRFLYPRYGFGQITDGLAAKLQPPNRILTKRRLVEVHHDDERITGVTAERPDGRRTHQACCELINSLPVDELVELMRPQPPTEVLEAARRLRYRSMVVLFIEINAERVSADHWIYVPSQKIHFCRLHEPKNWSDRMAPPDSTGLVLEYFCQEGDDTWRTPTAQLAREAAGELAQIGLLDPDRVTGFKAVRMRKAYPVYNLGYERNLRAVNAYLERFENLQNVGRNATFRYTSSDHYIDMGVKAAENVLGHDHDLSTIGRESGYAEA